MVCAGEGEEQGERRRVRMRVRQLDSSSFSSEGQDKYMTTRHERSKPLHNFTLPCLKWANQKFLRCMKVSDEDGGGDRRSPLLKLESSAATREKVMQNRGIEMGIGKESERVMTASKLRITKKRIAEEDEYDEDDGIQALREKCIFDLKTAANKMKDAISRDEVTVEVEEVEVMEEEQQPQQVRETPFVAALTAKSEVNEGRPWNLRTRRADAKSPIDSKKPNSSPLRTEAMKSPRWKACPSTEKIEIPKFSLSLSKKEIEEDFMKMVGHRQPRRPKKRARNVQKQIDLLFPGVWLTEISADSYKIPDTPENGKK